MFGKQGNRVVATCSMGLLGLALLGGCGDSEPDSAASSAPTSPMLAAGVLLPAADMPAWNGAMVWATTEPVEGTTALGVCALPTPESLGAVDVQTQDYSATSAPEEGTIPDPHGTPMLGINQVSLFNDEAAAGAAMASMGIAMGTCDPGTLNGTDQTSSQISTTATGQTWTANALDAENPDLGTFEFVGFAVKGSALTTVGFSLVGQDANYEEDPLTAAMDASLALLP